MRKKEDVMMSREVYSITIGSQQVVLLLWVDCFAEDKGGEGRDLMMNTMVILGRPGQCRDEWYGRIPIPITQFLP